MRSGYGRVPTELLPFFPGGSVGHFRQGFVVKLHHITLLDAGWGTGLCYSVVAGESLRASGHSGSQELEQWWP